MHKDTRSDSELNAIIAHWIGWRNVANGHGEETRYVGTPSEVVVIVRVPDFCKSLDAVAVAEDHLGVDQRVIFSVWKLPAVTDCYNLASERRGGSSTTWHNIHATARQRAEALVAVIESHA